MISTGALSPGQRLPAERELAEALKRAEGGFVESDRTIAMLVEDFLKSKEISRKITARSLADYRYQSEKYVLPYVGHIELRRLRFDHIQTLVNTLAGEGKASETVRKAYRVVHAALVYAVKLRLAYNPAAAVELPRLDRREMHALSPEEARRLLSAARGERHGALLAFFLGTGCRPSEAYALAWEDLDLDRGVVTLWRSVERVGTTLRIVERTKTEKSRRTLSLASSLVELLRSHRARQAQLILEAGTAYDRLADLVFANDRGGILDPRNVVNRAFKPALARAGLPPEIRLYDLRHSHATLLLHEGVNVKAVSARLGHASAAMTLDRYAHALPAADAQAVKVLEAALGD